MKEYKSRLKSTLRGSDIAHLTAERVLANRRTASSRRTVQKTNIYSLRSWRG